MQDLAVSESKQIPFFGVRAFARQLLIENERLTRERDDNFRERTGLQEQVDRLTDELSALRTDFENNAQQLRALGGMSLREIDERRIRLSSEADHLAKQIIDARAQMAAEWEEARAKVREAEQTIVETRETALLQEVGVYEYRHPLSDAVAYQAALERLQDAIKASTKKDGGAILATTTWQVNGSSSEGQKMVREVSKLMLRAFNAEADNLARSLKPYRLSSAVQRLKKVEETVRKLGVTMKLRISPAYLQLRIDELELTADFLQKQAEEKEEERRERERLREERKVLQEIERERAKLDKEKQHYLNALEALESKGDEAAIQRLQAQLQEVDCAIESITARAANTRAGYVYVISNIGSFGEKMVKVGMTRRLDPMERIRELSDASVPFNFDVHALFFSNDAVGIENAMHDRFADSRVNAINRRREFFHATPLEVKAQLATLTGELLEFREVAEAIEYRQTLRMHKTDEGGAIAAG
ncbi:DUF4041 domain-containing protein [Bradyrhizobium septentrionale]|uniref:DUF4041 domain-containing protein n=1 Tax=Bradyrhizobium septentrionale TaxID=1404411 RepID=A0ABZ2NUN2_9BRAD